ncbi:DUF6220 domain-containing protein [Paenibacillus sp. GCM10027626]
MFLAGYALFVDSKQWGTHANFAGIFAFIPFVLLILSFPAQFPRRIT